MPEILAAIIIANHPTQYGFDEITLDPPVLTDTVTINYAVDLRLVSDLVDASVDELMALNPSLLRMATPPETAFDLHLPAGTAALYEQRIAGIPESKRTAWRYHRVAPDDSLASVAHTYRVTVAELAAANQLQRTRALRALKLWLCRSRRLPPRRCTPCCTRPAAGTRWFRSPIASACLLTSCGAGTRFPAVSKWNRDDTCMWPSPLRCSGAAPTIAADHHRHTPRRMEVRTLRLRAVAIRHPRRRAPRISRKQRQRRATRKKQK